MLPLKCDALFTYFSKIHFILSWRIPRISLIAPPLRLKPVNRILIKILKNYSKIAFLISVSA